MKKYDIAAYIWPAYTGKEPRTKMFWPEGYGEWQSVKSAKPKYEGHQWPKRPLWGYVDEADPYVMEMQINAALRHGVNTFIYDWYWYDGRPFLEQCLNEGFLQAANNQDMKFYLMWANHDAVGLWDKRISDDPDAGQNVIWQGAVSPSTLADVREHVISRYFGKENYYKINGCPVFMIYDIGNLIRGLGGIEAARKEIEGFREAVKAAGFPDLHLQITIWGENTLNLSGVDSAKDVCARDLVEALGADSVTHYQFVHFADVSKDYPDVLPEVKAEWDRIEQSYPVPYFPHVSIGWDNNPRFQSLILPIMGECSPANFTEGLKMAKAYADRHPEQPPLITINSWNEWTENSYLEPDDVFGYGYLEAIKQVFLEDEA